MAYDLQYLDDSAQWWSEVLQDHPEEAVHRAHLLLSRGVKNENGCLQTPTLRPAKTRFRGRCVDAYRFVYCVLNEVAATRDDLVRHRCQNRRCINPDHLILGTHAENRQDDLDYAANGVDFRFL